MAPAGGPELGPTVFEAMREFWWLILFTALVGAGCGVVYGLVREPTYTAESRLSVGRIDVSTQSITGFVVAAQTLADSYSRAIVARPVVRDTAAAAGIAPSEVVERLSASPIPQSPVMQVSATGETEREAVRTANAGSRALVDYVQRLNRFNPDSKDLLARFNRASQRYGEARAALLESGGSAAAQAKVSGARLEVRTAEDLYRISQAGQATPNTLQPLALAVDAKGDQSSTLQQAIFAGVVFGFLLGAGLAQLAYRRF